VGGSAAEAGSAVIHRTLSSLHPQLTAEGNGLSKVDVTSHISTARYLDVQAEKVFKVIWQKATSSLLVAANALVHLPWRQVNNAQCSHA